MVTFTGAGNPLSNTGEQTYFTGNDLQGRFTHVNPPPHQDMNTGGGGGGLSPQTQQLMATAGMMYLGAGAPGLKSAYNGLFGSKPGTGPGSTPIKPDASAGPGATTQAQYDAVNSGNGALPSSATTPAGALPPAGSAPPGSVPVTPAASPGIAQSVTTPVIDGSNLATGVGDASLTGSGQMGADLGAQTATSAAVSSAPEDATAIAGADSAAGAGAGLAGGAGAVGGGVLGSYLASQIAPGNSTASLIGGLGGSAAGYAALAMLLAKGGRAHPIDDYMDNPHMSSGMLPGRVKGPGSGQSDSIPAMLSDGEYVVPAWAVSMMGHGSNDAGANKLDSMFSTMKKIGSQTMGAMPGPRR